MAKPRRKFEVANRRRQVAEWALKGWTQEQIAGRLGVSQPTVARDLEAVRTSWRQSAVADFEEARGQQLEKLALIETEAWAAWQRSQSPLQAAARTEGKAGIQTRTSLAHQNGDPRFLDQVYKCITQRCVLLGLQPPANLHQDDFDASISVEVRRERILGLITELGERERAASPGARPDDRQPGGPGGDGDPGQMAPGPAPDASRPDAAGGH